MSNLSTARQPGGTAWEENTVQASQGPPFHMLLALNQQLTNYKSKSKAFPPNNPPKPPVPINPKDLPDDTWSFLLPLPMNGITASTNAQSPSSLPVRGGEGEAIPSGYTNQLWTRPYFITTRQREVPSDGGNAEGWQRGQSHMPSRGSHGRGRNKHYKKRGAGEYLRRDWGEGSSHAAGDKQNLNENRERSRTGNIRSRDRGRGKVRGTSNERGDGWGRDFGAEDRQYPREERESGREWQDHQMQSQARRWSDRRDNIRLPDSPPVSMDKHIDITSRVSTPSSYARSPSYSPEPAKERKWSRHNSQPHESDRYSSASFKASMRLAKQNLDATIPRIVSQPVKWWKESNRAPAEAAAEIPEDSCRDQSEARCPQLQLLPLTAGTEALCLGLSVGVTRLESAGRPDRQLEAGTSEDPVVLGHDSDDDKKPTLETLMAHRTSGQKDHVLEKPVACATPRETAEGSETTITTQFPELLKHMSAEQLRAMIIAMAVNSKTTATTGTEPSVATVVDTETDEPPVLDTTLESPAIAADTEVPWVPAVHEGHDTLYGRDLPGPSYVCELNWCQETLINKAAFARHRLDHSCLAFAHGGKMYTRQNALDPRTAWCCDHCPYSSHRRKLFYRHMKRTHCTIEADQSVSATGLDHPVGSAEIGGEMQNRWTTPSTMTQDPSEGNGNSPSWSTSRAPGRAQSRPAVARVWKGSSTRGQWVETVIRADRSSEGSPAPVKRSKRSAPCEEGNATPEDRSGVKRRRVKESSSAAAAACEKAKLSAVNASSSESVIDEVFPCSGPLVRETQCLLTGESGAPQTQGEELDRQSARTVRTAQTMMGSSESLVEEEEEEMIRPQEMVRGRAIGRCVIQ